MSFLNEQDSLSIMNLHAILPQEKHKGVARVRVQEEYVIVVLLLKELLIVHIIHSYIHSFTFISIHPVTLVISNG